MQETNNATVVELEAQLRVVRDENARLRHLQDTMISVYGAPGLDAAQVAQKNIELERKVDELKDNVSLLSQDIRDRRC